MHCLGWFGLGFGGIELSWSGCGTKHTACTVTVFTSIDQAGISPRIFFLLFKFSPDSNPYKISQTEMNFLLHWVLERTKCLANRNMVFTWNVRAGISLRKILSHVFFVNSSVWALISQCQYSANHPRTRPSVYKFVDLMRCPHYLLIQVKIYDWRFKGPRVISVFESINYWHNHSFEYAGAYLVQWYERPFPQPLWI